MSLSAKLTSWEPYALAVLRIMAGLLFLVHGTQKFLSFPPGERAGTGWGFESLGAYGGAIEIVAGVLITIGWFTRSAAFIASGEMAVAYWLVHAPQNFFPINNGGEAAVLFCFVFLYLVFSGPGAWSVDGAATHVEVTEADRA